MKYCDLHCDALTNEGVLQVTGENLRKGGCLLQCFAAFVSVKNGRYARALALCDCFDGLCKKEGFHPVLRADDLREDKINALLTVEEGGAIEGNIGKLYALYGRGVRMMGLTWNYPNEIGFPSFFRYPDDLRTREPTRGLTPFGRSVVAEMNELGMIIDLSHGSDQLLADVLSISRQPVVASHSNARAVYDCPRNLSDGQIRAIAEGGGVVGLNFCARFLADDLSAEGQRAAILAHARAIVNAGGEDCLALGSDFDGIPANAFLPTPAKMPVLLEALTKAFGVRVTEKFASGNFLRVFRAVCG